MLFELSDEEATVNLGAQLAEVAQPGDVIFLHGELGAGKTALSRGFLRHFFANPSLEVPSPSYLICFTYGDAAADATPEVPTSSSANGHGSRRRTAGRPRLPGVNVLHLDPYRLPEGKVASLIDLAPAFARHICLIEWPESTWAEKKTKFVPTKSSRAAAIPALHLPPELPAAAADGGAASSTPANDAPHGATAPTASTQLSPDGVPPFPFLTLLVSGGHNLLVLTTALGAHAILGSTLDDSIGEAFDKTARLLGIPQIPGGPVLERLAREGDPRRHALPAPLSKTKDAELRASCDFSYAGLKSAVRQLLETRLPPIRRSELPAAELQRELADVAASFQRVAVEHLAQRTARALEWALETAPNLTCLVVAGGVAANLLVRSELARVASEAGLPMVCPPLRLCMDNGLMVAWTGVQRLRLGLAERPLRADADDETQRLFVEVRPKWPLGPRDPRSKTLQQQLSKRKQPHNQPNQPAQTAPAETLEEPLVAEDVDADGQASMTKPNGQASKRPRAEAEVES
eukprot:jgi/Chrpa1/7223/Chrysochromulina_OHIO_Genome00019709-RA